MKSQQWISSFGPGPDGPVQVHSAPSSPRTRRRRRRRRRPRAAAAADRRRKIVSGQFDEENPFVLISSALLVQPDEGVLDLVVDRIGDNLPQSTEKSRIIVIPVGARHKCQQGIQLAVGPQPLWLRNHNSGFAPRIMVKRLATSPHDLLGITDSACKNQSVVVSLQYGPFNPYIPIRSTTIGKSRVARDPIAMHTSWRSNSDIASVISIGGAPPPARVRARGAEGVRSPVSDVRTWYRPARATPSEVRDRHAMPADTCTHSVHPPARYTRDSCAHGMRDLSKKMMNSRRICPADGSQYKQSAVGLVFMESAAGLSLETSKVESAVRNQAEAKLNQLEHNKLAGTMTTSCKR
ncbi:hypothetical protein F511_19829 [Dorcoceras hygrometricum]|uniref:Uncharacterized protein n=1 Tax=Dorcoceras hygrometricum TaxID=472368 RepID=A0A2Z7AXQ6_9LAMI|nr:hypothetical protein F511_19829 [Dorcoceras hygrometricum]